MQWEYLRVPIQPEFDERLNERLGYLNQLGADGWELVSVLGAGGSPVAYLKRPKQSAAFVSIAGPAQ